MPFCVCVCVCVCVSARAYIFSDNVVVSVFSLVGWLVGFVCVCVWGGGGGVVVVVVFFGGKTAAPSQRDLLKSARSYS